jgi:hypothetical protein
MEIKCPKCGVWTENHPSLCTSCGYSFQAAKEKRAEAHPQFAAPGPPKFEFPMLHLNPNDPWYTRAGKRMLYTVQMVVMAAAGGMAWMAYWIAV